MPALDQAVLSDVSDRLAAYLAELPGYGAPTYLNSGGSAAVFKVETPVGIRVIKVCDPKFLEGERGKAEKRRLALQRRLIGHKCDGLVALFRVDEAHGTAFIEMEFVDWPQLNDVLAEVPDAEVAPLIEQLVAAVRYLEAQEIVHRDIKPENIHISPDFRKLKVLDLGVAREIRLDEEEAVIATDHGGQRPFLATAQYSSPEYLFRLDPPSPTLWKGLSIYQVGAVLHDLITKKPLYDTEVSLANRWLLARAVLTKTPSFADADPKRLVELKALASRCLIRDLQTRLQLVDWSDFSNANANPLAALKSKLAKGVGIGGRAAAASAARVAFDREQFQKRFREGVKLTLIEVCGNRLPPTVSQFEENLPYQFTIQFQLRDRSAVTFLVSFSWLEALEDKSANVSVAGTIVELGVALPNPDQRLHLACVATLANDEDLAIYEVSCIVAKALQTALEMLESNPQEGNYLGVDLLDAAAKTEPKK